MRAGARGGRRAAGGLEFADYLLGAYSSTLLIVRQIPYVGHQQYLGFYAQDSWRVTNKLTLNYGLRYEYWSPWAVPRNTTLSFNDKTGQPAFALQNPNDFLDRSEVLRRLRAADAGRAEGGVHDRDQELRAARWA